MSDSRLLIAIAFDFFVFTIWFCYLKRMCAPTWYSYQDAGNSSNHRKEPEMINHLGYGLKNDSNKLTKGLQYVGVRPPHICCTTVTPQLVQSRTRLSTFANRAF